jgi:hypothetical protein
MKRKNKIKTDIDQKVQILKDKLSLSLTLLKIKAMELASLLASLELVAT